MLPDGESNEIDRNRDRQVRQTCVSVRTAMLKYNRQSDRQTDTETETGRKRHRQADRMRERIR